MLFAVSPFSIFWLYLFFRSIKIYLQAPIFLEEEGNYPKNKDIYEAMNHRNQGKAACFVKQVP